MFIFYYLYIFFKHNYAFCVRACVLCVCFFYPFFYLLNNDLINKYKNLIDISLNNVNNNISKLMMILLI